MSSAVRREEEERESRPVTRTRSPLGKRRSFPARSYDVPFRSRPVGQVPLGRSVPSTLLAWGAPRSSPFWSSEGWLSYWPPFGSYWGGAGWACPFGPYWTFGSFWSGGGWPGPFGAYRSFGAYW